MHRRAAELLYYDNAVAVLLKPAGLLSVSGRRDGSIVHNAVSAVSGWLAHRGASAAQQPPLFASALNRPSDIEQAHVLHRLDAATSGLLLVPTHRCMLSGLARLLASRAFDKVYEAVLDTRYTVAESPLLSFDHGSVDTPLGRNSHIPLVQGATGLGVRPALTNWRVMERGDGAVRVEFRPVTGRTHQLRLHAALPPPLGLGAPILGDGMYGDPRLAAHSYLHELAARYHGHDGEARGAAWRLLSEFLARSESDLRASRLPYLSSCPFVDHCSAYSIRGSHTGIARLLLHAREVHIPDDVSGQDDGWAAGIRAAEDAGLAHGESQPILGIDIEPEGHNEHENEADAVEAWLPVDTSSRAPTLEPPPLIEPFVVDQRHRLRSLQDRVDSSVKAHNGSFFQVSHSYGTCEARKQRLKRPGTTIPDPANKSRNVRVRIVSLKVQTPF